MVIIQVAMPDITIPNGQQFSPAINWDQLYSDAEAISVQSPVGMTETISYQTSFDGITWGDLVDSTATALKGPQAASQTLIYNGIITSIQYWRFKANGNVGADRTFKITKAYRAS